MTSACVQPIASYEDEAALRAFCDKALDMLGDAGGVFAGDGALVVIKPNWIQEAHDQDPDEWESLITHPALVLAMVEAAARRMGGKGTIALCDAPHTYAGFEAILARGNLRQRLEQTAAQWPDLNLEIIDLRREVWITKDDVVVSRRPNPHDPRGYVALDLGRHSLFHGHPGEGRYYGADYDTTVVNAHHRGALQEYLLAGTPMACGLFINMPKLKTHKKTGITCSLKNLVGINGDKNWLPHHTEGSPANGGDEFPAEHWATRLERSLKQAGRKAALSLPVLGPWLFRQMRRAGKQVLGDSQSTIRNGNWHGNNTCWRMALDLNRALLYGAMDGTWREQDAPKPYLTVIDGLTGGQGNGPVSPEPVHAGVLIASTNAAAADAAAARLMGFNPNSIPIVREAFAPHRWPIGPPGGLDTLEVFDAREDAAVPVMQLREAVPGGFEPHFGWPNLRAGR